MNTRTLLDWMFFPTDSAPRSSILIRCMAGGVFLWEGILKFVYTNQGVGRFTKLGIPFPGPTAHFVAVIEMIVAMLTTKISLYLGTSPLPLPPAPPQVGPWAVLHEIRSDYAQIMSTLFLL